MRVREENIDRDADFDIRMSDRVWRRKKGTAKLVLVDHLRWEIDKVLGKKGCLIEFEIPSLEITVNFVPTHDFCEKFLDWMLEAEWLNDQFHFKDPVMDKNRPLQLVDKIERISHIINKWQKPTSNQETLKLSDFMKLSS